MFLRTAIEASGERKIHTLSGDRFRHRKLQKKPIHRCNIFSKDDGNVMFFYYFCRWFYKAKNYYKILI